MADIILPQAETARRLVPLLVELLCVTEADIGPDVLLVPASADRDMPNLGADSLDMVELAMVIEEEFGIILPDDEVEAITGFTFGQLVDCVHARLGAAA